MRFIQSISKALLLLAMAMCAQNSFAQDFTSVDTLKFYDALQFRMINKGWNNSETPYFRVPAYLKDSCRTTLYERLRCTSGEGFRFRTNSRCVAARYNLLTNMHMAHMADTGIKGADLYIWDEDDQKWQFVNCTRPVRDYSWKPGTPRKGKKFVFYGTSIMQGGCACRPGMVATSILQRDLNIECVNVAISGEGKMDTYMARALAEIPDVEAFIIDPIPNCTKNMCDSLTYGFVNILRQARPNVPIIMVEGPMYSYAKYSSFYGKYLPQKNYEFHKNYLKLRAENPKNLYYVDCENLWGPDNEGTVDGIHLTDIGFYWYAQKLKPYLKAIMDGKPVPFQDKVNKPYKEIK